MKTYPHIHSMVLIMWLFIAINGSWAGGGFHVFTDVNGRSIKGQLVGFDAGSQVVTIKREDDKRCRVRLAVFSNDDQQYIRVQSLKKDFMHSIIMTARLAKLDSAGADYGARYKAGYIKVLKYEVILDNRSTFRFKEIDIEYCIFYRQGTRNRQGMDFIQGVQYGHWRVDLMKPDSRPVLEAEPIVLYDEDRTETLFGSSGGAKGEIVGIWVRASTALPNGNRIIREFCSPDRIRSSEDWTDTTKLAGLNNTVAKIAAYP